MQSFKKILVAIAIDDQGQLPPPSQEALKRGLWLGAANGAALTLITVSDAAESSATTTEMDVLTRCHQQIIQDAAAQGVQVESKICSGMRWLEIIHAVLRDNFDLVIVGTREHGFARRMLYGSTAMRLLRKCPCPVWVTRPHADVEMPTIVAADDLQEVGKRVLDLGVGAAQLMQGKLLVVNAVQFPLLGGLVRTEAPESEIEEYRSNVRTDAERAIHDRLAATDYRTIPGGTQILVEGGPSDVVISNALDTHKPDLLVMGTLGRGGIPGLLLGNTAERLLPILECSLLAIKPDDFICPIKLKDS